MKRENITEKIVKGENLAQSEELTGWISQSAENQKEYIRYKNLWALLQTGKEMDGKSISDDYERVKEQAGIFKKRIAIYDFVKYAAIIILALTGGYFINQLTQNQESAVNEISVPSGNRSLIILPDGSEAWLTNNSKLKYPGSFEDKARDVTLTGEAYFNIAHNENKPFFVNLGEHRVKVLGTEFSVVSYPEDDFLRVDLVSGKVQLDVGTKSGGFRSYNIDPLHSLVLNRKSGKLVQSMLPDSFFKYWQEGVYAFKDETFAELSKKMERIYGVEIIFEDKSIESRTFTGSFNIDDNIYTMMEVFKRASGMPFDYTIERNRIYIKSAK